MPDFRLTMRKTAFNVTFCNILRAPAYLAKVQDMIGRLTDEDEMIGAGLGEHRDGLALELAALDVRASADDQETRWMDLTD